MSETKREVKVSEEEAEAQREVYNYIFGFVGMAVAKSVVDLRIPDVLEAHGTPMTLPELSAALGCEPLLLHRIMRFLTHRKIFKEERSSSHGAISYAQTPLSRLLTTTGDKAMGAILLMESTPEMLMPWLGLSRRVSVANGKLPPAAAANGDDTWKTHAGATKTAKEKATPYEEANGEDLWSYAASHKYYSNLINQSMACMARITVPEMIRASPEVFQGLNSMVDVGGGIGTAMGLVAEAFPGIRTVNFDLPHLVAEAPEIKGVEHVAGNFFESLPKANAAFIMQVLHDWGDEECIEILKRCKEAVPKERGKVIIVDIVVDNEEQKEDNLRDVRLMLDMIMMAHTSNGKERNFAEWKYVIEKAGFSSFTIKTIKAIQSVIVAIP